MHVALLIQDPLEAQGLKWLLTSQWNDVTVEIVEPIDILKDAYLCIIDMHYVMSGEVEPPEHIHWIGISSDRTFQTVYKALSCKAEDVLFRPFQPERLLKQVQQMRFRWRNESEQLRGQASSNEEMVSYEDLLVGNAVPDRPVTVSLIAPSQIDEISNLVREMKNFDFPDRYRVFPFSDFLFTIHYSQEEEPLREAYSIFFSNYKRQSDALLTIYLHTDNGQSNYRDLYQKLRKVQEGIFYDGYDILSIVKEELKWREMDPFLSPSEQERWVEMLEKRQVVQIREWMEKDFLALSPPFPDPEMIRVRLTSILAQIRRYMIAHAYQTPSLEAAYHSLFETIIRERVMYQIIQLFLSFVNKLLEQSEQQAANENRIVDKVRELMKENFRNASWGMEACAEELDIHKNTLSRKYSTEAGESFSKSLLKIKLNEAERLLKKTDLSIEEVSRAAGFTYATYFSKCFKEKNGMTPYRYRKLQGSRKK